MQKLVAKTHTYLAVFFAPVIVFFSISGAFQLFSMHRDMKDGSYKAPELLKQFASLHMHQGRYGLGVTKSADAFGPIMIKYLSLAGAMGLVVLALLGLWLGFVRTPKKRRWILAALLLLGFVLPVICLFV